MSDDLYRRAREVRERAYAPYSNFLVGAAVRTPGKLAFPAGVTTTAFDFTNRASHGPALAGIEGLVLISPPLDPEAPAKVNPLVDAAKASGVVGAMPRFMPSYRPYIETQ